MSTESDEPDIYCKTCGGTGHVRVTDPEEGSFEAMCPHCHGFGRQ